jgi:hypothetical protein
MAENASRGISLWVPLMEQELFSLPVHLNSSSVFSGIHVDHY